MTAKIEDRRLDRYIQTSLHLAGFSLVQVWPDFGENDRATVCVQDVFECHFFQFGPSCLSSLHHDPVGEDITHDANTMYG